MELVNEYHNLKNKNEQLEKDKTLLSIEVENLKCGILKKSDNCLVCSSGFSLSGSSQNIQLLNPTSDVNEEIVNILKEKGITIKKDSYFPLDVIVTVNEETFYKNPYCESARKELEKMDRRIKEKEAELEVLQKEVEWLNGQKKSNGFFNLFK